VTALVRRMRFVRSAAAARKRGARRRSREGDGSPTPKTSRRPGRASAISSSKLEQPLRKVLRLRYGNLAEL